MTKQHKQTKKAISSYQMTKGLPVDGKATESFLKLY
ncbi:MAG: peptidoglycan-binding protein [Magnetococcales bacterium]|nr:peptidoglycan-binding protein [Magnetococcales bacterium]